MEVLANHFCQHAIILESIKNPFYVGLIKVGEFDQKVIILEPSEKSYLIKASDIDNEKRSIAGICLNELLDMLQSSEEFGGHDLVILDKCPCEQ